MKQKHTCTTARVYCPVNDSVYNVRSARIILFLITFVLFMYFGNPASVSAMSWNSTKSVVWTVEHDTQEDEKVQKPCGTILNSDEYTKSSQFLNKSQNNKSPPCHLTNTLKVRTSIIKEHMHFSLIYLVTLSIFFWINIGNFPLPSMKLTCHVPHSNQIASPWMFIRHATNTHQEYLNHGSYHRPKTPSFVKVRDVKALTTGSNIEQAGFLNPSKWCQWYGVGVPLLLLHCYYSIPWQTIFASKEKTSNKVIIVLL